MCDDKTSSQGEQDNSANLDERLAIQKAICDHKTIDEKIEFFASGRAHETGIIAQAKVPAVIKFLKQHKALTGA